LNGEEFSSDQRSGCVDEFLVDERGLQCAVMLRIYLVVRSLFMDI
jgi:hypothetical protein